MPEPMIVKTLTHARSGRVIGRVMDVEVRCMWPDICRLLADHFDINDPDEIDVWEDGEGGDYAVFGPVLLARIDTTYTVPLPPAAPSILQRYASDGASLIALAAFASLLFILIAIIETRSM